MRSEKTVIQYRQGARSFDKYLEAHGRTIEQLHNDDLEDYVRWLLDEKKKPNTIHNYVTIAKLYVKWAGKSGIEVPVLEKPMLPHIQKRRLEILPWKFIPTYNEACIRYVDEPYRTALLLLPMTGLRVSEMCALEIKDVILGPKTEENPEGSAQLHVIGKGKGGGKYRPVPVLSDGIQVLAHYVIVTRPQLARSRWLFPAKRAAGKSIVRHQITKRLQVVKRKIGLQKLYPHLLRSTYATILNENGVQGFDLAQIMGHSDVRVTSGYVHPVESRLLSDVSRLSYRKKIR